MLTLFVVLFAIFGGLVLTLIVLQDRMIDAQRDLIHGLFQVQRRTLVLAQKAHNTHPPGKAAARASGHVRNAAPATPDSASV